MRAVCLRLHVRCVFVRLQQVDRQTTRLAFACELVLQQRELGGQ